MLAEISGTKKADLKAKIEELQTNSKTKNIRDLYRGIGDFKKGYKPPTVLRRGEGSISPSYLMYMGLVIGRQKYA
jgi:hypothetical protein